MKTLVAVALAASIVTGVQTVWADEAFDKRKTEAVAEIDERITKLQEHKTCVSGAADAEALKQCRTAMKDWHQAERMEHMEKRKARMEQRIQKMKAKKE